jgi:hypothetical protein
VELLNRTSWAAESLLLSDRHGRERLVVVVKGTWAVEGGRARPSDEPEPVRLVDEYHGEPGVSSLRFAGDAALFKPATDVVLVGHARAPKGRARQMDVRLTVGKISKTIRVFGDRFWRKTMGLRTASDPEPFDLIPLVYERAYGGTDESDPDRPQSVPENPVGVGFRGKRSKLPKTDVPLPNLEHPESLIRSPRDRPKVAGFGFVSPQWQPRLRYAGTYDDAWMRDRAPFLPDDFDERFHQAAPWDQVVPGYLRGGEAIRVERASVSGEMSFEVPRERPEVALLVEGRRVELPLALDTLVVDGDSERFTTVWRGNVDVHDRVYDVDWIKITAGGPS